MSRSKAQPKKCRKLLTPALDFSPQIQYGYDSIHAYLALLRLKEADSKRGNPANVHRFANRCQIETQEDSRKKISKNPSATAKLE